MTIIPALVATAVFVGLIYWRDEFDDGDMRALTWYVGLPLSFAVAVSLWLAVAHA